MERFLTSLIGGLMCTSAWLAFAPLKAGPTQTLVPTPVAPSTKAIIQRPNVLAPIRAPAPTAYSEMTERPLFSSTRRPATVNNARTPPESLTPKPIEASLHGVLTSGDSERYAILVQIDGESRSVSVGQVFNGWNVLEIGEDWIVLEFNRRRQTLELHTTPR